MRTGGSASCPSVRLSWHRPRLPHSAAVPFKSCAAWHWAVAVALINGWSKRKQPQAELEHLPDGMLQPGCACPSSPHPPAAQMVTAGTLACCLDQHRWVRRRMLREGLASALRAVVDRAQRAP